VVLSGIQTITEKVTNQLRNDIICGIYQPGERLTVKQISEQYGVGAMPVREAFMILKGEEFIEMLPYKGAVVLAMNKKYVQDVLEVNTYLQAVFSVKACRLGIDNDKMSQIEDIYAQMEQFAGKGDSAEFMELNLKFHRLIMEQCQNDKALSLFEEYFTLANAIRSRYSVTQQRMDEIKRQHGEIVRCLKSGDSDGLYEAIIRHRTDAESDFVKAVD